MCAPLQVRLQYLGLLILEPQLAPIVQQLKEHMSELPVDSGRGFSIRDLTVGDMEKHDMSAIVSNVMERKFHSAFMPLVEGPRWAPGSSAV